MEGLLEPDAKGAQCGSRIHITAVQYRYTCCKLRFWTLKKPQVDEERPEAHVPLPPYVVDDLLLCGGLVRIPVEIPRQMDTEIRWRIQSGSE